MITSSHLLLYDLIEEKMALPRWCLVTKRPCDCREGCERMAKLPIKVSGLRLTKSGKLEKVDKGASHPVVKARRKRTKGKVTGVRAAK